MIIGRKKPFKKVLIANRGEIAVRIARTLAEMDIKSVAVYSEADRGSSHVSAADEAYCIGPGPSKDSYLNIDAILSAAKLSGADAVHPGYGFLSENPAFSRAVGKAGMTFIGASPKAIENLGVKSRARELAVKAKVPVIPGSEGVVKKDHFKTAGKIGYPIMIKAAMGGGGKGMRMVCEEKDFDKCLNMACSEAKAAFGDDRVYFERVILNPRHIEVQIAADSRGNVIAMPERDCSTQRRHQKLLEESPSPAVDAALRKELADAAVRIIKKASYTGLGTVEFLLDADKKFYFMEVNTRLQVEHPVTEAVTGLDLVRLQIDIAQGKKLDISAERALEFNGHAIEHRINAEDPSSGFAPSPGMVDEWVPSGGIGVRVDTHVYTGYTIPSYYDSLIAKLIIWAPDRSSAVKRSLRAVNEFKIEGVKNTLAVHRQILENEEFKKGNMNTGLLEKILDENKK